MVMNRKAQTTTEKVLAAALAITIVVAALVILSFVYTIHNTGYIKATGIGVFVDPACTQTLSSINWGTLYPGNTVGTVAYVKNIQTTNVTMKLTTSGWSPSNAPTYITCTWNYTGVALQPSAVLLVQFKLAIASNVTGIGTFSFDMNINATSTS
jgi:protein-S-isoprenylcysteine O-methyltransferase Ste14